MEKYLFYFLIGFAAITLAFGAYLNNKINSTDSDLRTSISNNQSLDANQLKFLSTQVGQAVNQLNSFSQSSLLLPVGTILHFAGWEIPDGYSLCNGSEFLISQYADLFKVIGTTFNRGDIDTSLYFNVPDMRNLFARATDDTRQLGSVKPWTTGSPKNAFTTSDGDHDHNFPTSVFSFYQAGANQVYYYNEALGNTKYGRSNVVSTSLPSGKHSHTITGGDSETAPSNMALNFIIKIK